MLGSWVGNNKDYMDCAEFAEGTIIEPQIHVSASCCSQGQSAEPQYSKSYIVVVGHWKKKMQISDLLPALVKADGLSTVVSTQLLQSDEVREQPVAQLEII